MRRRLPPTPHMAVPRGLPGRPLNPNHLGRRLRTHGVPAITGRRAAPTSLAAHLPPAVLADLVRLQNGTAARWVRASGGDWTNYAAHVATAAITNHPVAPPTTGIPEQLDRVR